MSLAFTLVVNDAGEKFMPNAEGETESMSNGRNITCDDYVEFVGALDVFNYFPSRFTSLL